MSSSFVYPDTKLYLLHHKYQSHSWNENYFLFFINNYAYVYNVSECLPMHFQLNKYVEVNFPVHFHALLSIFLKMY